MAAQENNNPGENKQRKWVKIIENYPQDSQIFSGDKSLDRLKLSNKVLLRQRNVEVEREGKSKHQTSLNELFIFLRVFSQRSPICFEILHNSFNLSLKKISPPPR